MLTLAERILLACWRSAGHAVGAACGTTQTLAGAVGADGAATDAAMRALHAADYVEVDAFGIVSVTVAGAAEAKRHGDPRPHCR